MKWRAVMLWAVALGPVACAGLCFAYVDGYLLGERRGATAVVRRYYEHLRDGDIDAAYKLLCPEILAAGTYTVDDHREHLRGVSVESVDDVDDIFYDTSMDGTYVTVQVTGTQAGGARFVTDVVAGVYTAGTRVCDAPGWHIDGPDEE
ncbi:hypothetical protein [Dactylosporangium sp. NPDC005555]|uniref:hypothetical protein n=1 Tax=Dactylosporangium sp. NPDC005555 TaxID=3154889 RepID=UPI0033A625C6